MGPLAWPFPKVGTTRASRGGASDTLHYTGRPRDNTQRRPPSGTAIDIPRHRYLGIPPPLAPPPALAGRFEGSPDWQSRRSRLGLTSSVLWDLFVPLGIEAFTREFECLWPRCLVQFSFFGETTEETLVVVYSIVCSVVCAA